MAQLNYINERRVKACRDCGAPITLVQNRAGKWYAVDVYHDDRLGSSYYRSGIGSNGNLTPFHKCQQPAPFPSNEERAKARREREFARAYLAKQRAGATDGELVEFAKEWQF